MFFNLFILIVWLLALVSPVGDYRKYIQSLSDPRIIAPDKHPHMILVSESVLSVFPPAPAPLPRYSPLVVPVYIHGKGRAATPVRFNRSKRVQSIYKWVDVLFDYFTEFVGRPRPTKTSHHPTRTVVPVHPAPPAPSSKILSSSPASPTGSTFDLAGLWNTYTPIIAWIASTFLVIVATFIRFLARPRVVTDQGDSVTPDHNITRAGDLASTLEISSRPTAPLANYDSIIDLYSPPDYSSVTHERISFDSDKANFRNPVPEDIPLPASTETELFELTNSSSSAPARDASALSAWIDTKTGVEGTTDTYGASVGGKTLEPAVSNSSIGSIIRMYADLSPGISPSPSLSSVAPSRSTEASDRFPSGSYPANQAVARGVYQAPSRHGAMERRGNLYGRVYDGWTGNPDAEISSGSGTLPTGLGLAPTSPIPTPTDPTTQDLLSASPSVADLSVTISQGSLYEQLGGFIHAQDHDIDSTRFGTEASSMDTGSPQVQVGPILSVANLDSTNIPLPPSPCAERGALLPHEVKVDLTWYATGLDPVDIPLPPSLPTELGQYPASMRSIRPLAIGAKRKLGRVLDAETRGNV
ncbi:unnamed protein product [Rhizoctonia solani]|uniref:Transmembrane protein n=1 Tax=Rhizoctonia solani TaxID=456999 RepID=A0A8H3H7M0_9AGAM|nr:unnamed protein product [Rhizoctonia solani]